VKDENRSLVSMLRHPCVLCSEIPFRSKLDTAVVWKILLLYSCMFWRRTGIHSSICHAHTILKQTKYVINIYMDILINKYIINKSLFNVVAESLPSLPSQRLMIMYTIHSHTLPLHSVFYTHNAQPHIRDYFVVRLM
jgi:hypothetical protein